MTTTPPDDLVGCAAGCGRKANKQDLEDGKVSDWDRLEITGWYRCLTCTQVLTAAQNLPGTTGEFTPDPLPKDSRGALKALPEPVPLHEKVKP